MNIGLLVPRLVTFETLADISHNNVNFQETKKINTKYIGMAVSIKKLKINEGLIIPHSILSPSNPARRFAYWFNLNFGDVIRIRHIQVYEGTLFVRVV